MSKQVVKITTRTTLAEIRNMLRADGFASVGERASDIKRAALAGCLLWTSERIVTTDRSRISARTQAQLDG